jgi:hypothetical protein
LTKSVVALLGATTGISVPDPAVNVDLMTFSGAENP